MKQTFRFLFIAVAMMMAGCEDEEGCDATIIPQEIVEFNIHIYVLNMIDHEPIYNYPVRYYLQKHFCDGDVGGAIQENGSTFYDGSYVSAIWPIPYTNEKDYVVCDFYAGPADERHYIMEIPYEEIKGQWEIHLTYTFYIDL